MLEIRGVTKSFGPPVGGIKAVDKVSFKIKSNCVVGLLGPNGAGKTTLMRIIVGFLTANNGEILWNGEEVDTKSIEHKSRVGYLPESNPLYGFMTVIEYLDFVAKLKDVSGENYQENLLKLAGDCGLTEVIGQKIETLSKGYKQRVGIAATLIGDPEILVLDEPTSGLDPNQIIEIRNLIKKLAKKKMVLFSTHILPEAKAICERLLIISQGKIVLDEETKKIKNLEKKFVELTS
jgi:ABC-2 type transport system ATP-binding protein